MDIEILRAALRARPTQEWPALAHKAGVSRKTIERLVHHPDYMPRYRNFVALAAALMDAPVDRRVA